MKWRGGRRSTNVEDRRGSSGRRAVAGGGGFLAIAIIAASIFFPEAVPFLRMIEGAGGGGQSVQQQAPAPVNDEMNAFVATTLGYTEDTWGAAFQAGAFPQAGQRYDPAVLVLFSGQTTSPCGVASAQSGPFYCPADGKIYIDPAFYDVMARQLKAPGDFAQAYVIAHEVAHHVQNLNGVLPEVNRLRMRASEVEGNRLTVRLELQADCFSGLWAREAQQRHNILERGDLEEALRAAYQVGDDVIMRMGGRRVDESKFTHGSAEQRARWFQIGFQQGTIAACDTFRQPYDQL